MKHVDGISVMTVYDAVSGFPSTGTKRKIYGTVDTIYMNEGVGYAIFTVLGDIPKYAALANMGAYFDVFISDKKEQFKRQPSFCLSTDGTGRLLLSSGGGNNRRSTAGGILAFIHDPVVLLWLSCICIPADGRSVAPF